MDVEKLKNIASAVRTGGKGSMRRWLFRLIGVCKNDALAAMHNYCLYMMLFRRQHAQVVISSYRCMQK
jgi:hypothetical protein